MRSEAKKIFKHGFNLTEQELRVIYKIATEQLEKNSNKAEIISSFEVKFSNGVIAEPKSIDEIVGFENIGSGQIVRLKIQIKTEVGTQSSSIELEFYDLDQDSSPQYESIKYVVVSDDRDWVFVTSSKLDERLSRLKRISLFRPLASTISPESRRQLTRSSIYLMFIILLVTMLFLMSRINKNVHDKKIRELDKIEAQWKNGIIKDPFELNFQLKRIDYSQDELEGFPFRMLEAGVLLFIPYLINPSLGLN